MKDLLERFCFCVPTHILYIPEKGSSAGLWQSPSLKFSTGFKSIHSDVTFLIWWVKVSGVEMKSGAKHVLKCFCLVSAFIAQPAAGGGWEDTNCAAVSPIKSSRDLLKYSSQIIAKRITSCALNFTGMRHPGAESSLLCLGSLIHPELSLSPFATAAASGLLPHPLFTLGLQEGWKQNKP